jgi:hypothetical protein
MDLRQCNYLCRGRRWPAFSNRVDGSTLAVDRSLAFGNSQPIDNSSGRMPSSKPGISSDCQRDAVLIEQALVALPMISGSPS